MLNPYFRLLRTAWKYARKEKPRYILVYAMLTTDSLIVALNPLLFGWFINILQQQGRDLKTSTFLYITAFMGLHVLRWSFHGPARVMECNLAFTLSSNFLEEKYHQVLHLPMHWHQEHHSGATISRVRKAYEALREFFQTGFGYLSDLTKFLFSFGAMLYFSPVYALFGLVLGILTSRAVSKFDKIFVQSIKEVNEREHRVSSILLDSFTNIITIITLRLQKHLHSYFSGTLKEVFVPYRRNVIINELKWFTAETAIGVTYTAVVVGYVLQHWTPGQTFYIGGLVTLIGYVTQFAGSFNELSWRYTQLVQYDTTIQTASVIGEAYARLHHTELKNHLPESWKKIEIQRLYFSYQTTPQPGFEHCFQGLHNLNLQIRRGARIALVGESGSGKSTLLKLLRGLYLPQQEPHLILDGHPAKIDFAGIGDIVTLFPQDPEIFENTVLYNITLGLPFSREAVMEACEIACFTAVVEQLPYGLDTNIHEKGVNLSGGQKQRLALVRGVLAAQNSTMVLFDEPTSNVDFKTEELIYDRLFKVFADKALISSLHHLHLINRFDYVYVLQKGVIVEEGTPEKLQASSRIATNYFQMEGQEARAQNE